MGHISAEDLVVNKNKWGSNKSYGEKKTNK